MPHEIVAARQRTNAKAMRKVMTDAERRLWNQLRAHRVMGLGFRRQVPVGKYVADFACSEHRLVVEIDGSHHRHWACLGIPGGFKPHLQRFVQDRIGGRYLERLDQSCKRPGHPQLLYSS